MNYFLVAMGLLWTLHVVYRNNYSSCMISLQQLDCIISRTNTTHPLSQSGWTRHIFCWKRTSGLYFTLHHKTFRPKCTYSPTMSTHVTAASKDFSSAVARPRYTTGLSQNLPLILELPVSKQLLYLSRTTNSSLTSLSKTFDKTSNQSTCSVFISLKSYWLTSFHYLILTELTVVIIIIMKFYYLSNEIKPHGRKKIYLNKSTSILILLTLQVTLRTSVVESMSTDIPLTTAGQTAQRSSLQIRKLTNIKGKFYQDSIYLSRLSERTNNKVGDSHYTAQQSKQKGASSNMLVSRTDQLLIDWSHYTVSKLSNNYLVTDTNETSAVIDPTNTQIYKSSEMDEKRNMLNMYLMSSATTSTLSPYQVPKQTSTADTVLTISDESDTRYSSDQMNVLEPLGLLSSFILELDTKDGLQSSVSSYFTIKDIPKEKSETTYISLDEFHFTPIKTNSLKFQESMELLPSFEISPSHVNYFLPTKSLPPETVTESEFSNKFIEFLKLHEKSSNKANISTHSASADMPLSQLTSNISVLTELYRLASQATKVSTNSTSYLFSADITDNEVRSTLSNSKIFNASEENLQTSPYEVRSSMSTCSDSKSIVGTVLGATMSSVLATDFKNTVTPQDIPYAKTITQQLSSVKNVQISSNIKFFPVSLKSDNFSISAAFSSVSIMSTNLGLKSSDKNLSTKLLLPYSQKSEIVASSPAKSNLAASESINSLLRMGNVVLSDNQIQSSFQLEAIVLPVKTTGIYLQDTIITSQQATQLDLTVNTALKSAQQTSSTDVEISLAVPKSKITPSVHVTRSPLKLSPTSLHSLSKPRLTSGVQTMHPVLILPSVLPIKLSQLQYLVAAGHSKIYASLNTTLISTSSKSLATSPVSVELTNSLFLKPTSPSLQQTSLISLESRSYSLEPILALLEFNSSSLTMSQASAHSPISLSPEPIQASARSKSPTLHIHILPAIEPEASSVLQTRPVSTHSMSSSSEVPLISSQESTSISIPTSTSMQKISVGTFTSIQSLGSTHASLDILNSLMLQVSTESASSQQTSFSSLKSYWEHKVSPSFSLLGPILSSHESTGISMPELSAGSHKSKFSLSPGPLDESIETTGSLVLQPSIEFLNSSSDLSTVLTIQSLQKTSSPFWKLIAETSQSTKSLPNDMALGTVQTGNSSVIETSNESLESMRGLSVGLLFDSEEPTSSFGIKTATDSLDSTSYLPLASSLVSSDSTVSSSNELTVAPLNITTFSSLEYLLSSTESTIFSLLKMSQLSQKSTGQLSLESSTTSTLLDPTLATFELSSLSLFEPNLQTTEKTTSCLLDFILSHQGSTSFSKPGLSTELQNPSRSLSVSHASESLETTYSPQPQLFNEHEYSTLSGPALESLKTTKLSILEMFTESIGLTKTLVPDPTLESLTSSSLLTASTRTLELTRSYTDSGESKKTWLSGFMFKSPKTASSSMTEISPESLETTGLLSESPILETLETTSSTRIKMPVGLLQLMNYLSPQSLLPYPCLTCSSTAGTVRSLLLEPSFSPIDSTSFSIQELSTEFKQSTEALLVHPTLASAKTTASQMHKLSTEYTESLKYVLPTPALASLGSTAFQSSETPLGHTKSLSTSLLEPIFSTQESIRLSMQEATLRLLMSTKSLSLGNALESLETTSSSMLQGSTELIELTRSLSTAPTLKSLDTKSHSMLEISSQTVEPTSSWSPDFTLQSPKTTYEDVEKTHSFRTGQPTASLALTSFSLTQASVTESTTGPPGVTRSASFEFTFISHESASSSSQKHSTETLGSASTLTPYNTLGVSAESTTYLSQDPFLDSLETAPFPSLLPTFATPGSTSSSLLGSSAKSRQSMNSESSETTHKPLKSMTCLSIKPTFESQQSANITRLELSTEHSKSRRYSSLDSTIKSFETMRPSMPRTITESPELTSIPPIQNMSESLVTENSLNLEKTTALAHPKHPLISEITLTSVYPVNLILASKHGTDFSALGLTLASETLTQIPLPEQESSRNQMKPTVIRASFSIPGPAPTSIYQKYSLNSNTKQTYLQSTRDAVLEAASEFQHQINPSSTRHLGVSEHQVSSNRLNNTVIAEVTSRFNIHIQQNGAISTHLHTSYISSNEIKTQSIHPSKSSITVTKLSSMTLNERTIQESTSSAQQTHLDLQHPTKSLMLEIIIKSVQPINSFKLKTMHSSSFSSISPTITATPTSTYQTHSFILKPAYAPLHPASSSTAASSSSVIQPTRTSVFGQVNVSSSSRKETMINSKQQGNFITVYSMKPKHSMLQGKPRTLTSSKTVEIASSSIKPNEFPVQGYILPSKQSTTYTTLKTLTTEHSTQLQPSFIPAHSAQKSLMKSVFSKLSSPIKPPAEAVFSNSTSNLKETYRKSIQSTSSSQPLSGLTHVHLMTFYHWYTSQSSIQLKSSMTSQHPRGHLNLNILSTPETSTSYSQLNLPSKSVHSKSSSQLQPSWKPQLSSKFFHNNLMQLKLTTPASDMKPSMTLNYIVSSSILKDTSIPADLTTSSNITITVPPAHEAQASHLRSSLTSVNFIKYSSKLVTSTRSIQLMPSFKLSLHLASFSASKDLMTSVQSMKFFKLNSTPGSTLSAQSTQQKLQNTTQTLSLTPVHLTNHSKLNTSMKSIVSINISTLYPSNPPVKYLKSTRSSKLSPSFESVQSTNLLQSNTLLAYRHSTSTLEQMPQLITYLTGSLQQKSISSTLVNSTSSSPIHFSLTFEHSTRYSVFKLSLTSKQLSSSLLDTRTKSESMASYQKQQTTNLHIEVFSTLVTTPILLLDSLKPQLIKTTIESGFSSLQTKRVDDTSEILHTPSISTSKLPSSVFLTEMSSASHYFKESVLGATLLKPIKKPSTETALFLEGQSNLLLPSKTLVASSLTAYLGNAIPEFLSNIIKPKGTVVSEQHTSSTVTEHFTQTQREKLSTLLSSSNTLLLSTSKTLDPIVLTDFLRNTRPIFSSTITKSLSTGISDQPTFLTVIEHSKSAPSYYVMTSVPTESVPVTIRHLSSSSTNAEHVYTSSEKYSTTATLQPSLQHRRSIYTLDTTPVLISEMIELPTIQSSKPSEGGTRTRATTISPTKVQSPTIPPTSSATRYPYYGVNNLLSVGIQVKLTVHIKTESFIENIVHGLEACYVEGMTYLQLNNRAKRRVGTSPGLLKRSIDVEIKVTNVERLFEDPTKVDVMFYVMKAGVPMSSRDSLEVFSQLSDVEASALLRYPVYRPFYVLAPSSATKPPSTQEVFTPLTLTLTVVPIAVVSITTVAVTVMCCIYRKRNTDKASQFWKKYKSLSLKKPTLEELDLIIDVEKGQIVSRGSSCNATPMLKPQQLKHDDHTNQETMIKSIGASHVLEDNVQSNFRRAYSDHNFGMRPERLKKLGFHFLDKTRNVSTKELHPKTLKSPIEIEDLNAKGNYLRTDTAAIQLMTQTGYDNCSKTVGVELTDERLYETLNNTHQESKPDRTIVTARADQIWQNSDTNKTTEPLSSQTVIMPSEISMSFNNPEQIVEPNSNLSKIKERLSEDGKTEKGKSYEKVSYRNINSAMQQSRPKLLMTQNQGFESNTISKPARYNSFTGATMSLGDHLTSFDEVSLSVDSATDTFSYTDYENEETTLTLDAGGELLTESSIDSTVTSRNYTYMLNQRLKKDNNTDKATLEYQQSKYKTRHKYLPEYGIVTDRENKQVNIQPTTRINPYGSPAELPYECYNNELYNYHANLNYATSCNDNVRDKIHSKDPPNFNSAPLHGNACSSSEVAVPVHSAEHSQFPRSGVIMEERQIVPNPEMGTHSFNKQVWAGSDSQYTMEEPIYDELSPVTGVVDPAKFSYLEPSSGIYRMHRADCVVDDGSEFAGDEFETVTFSSDQLESREHRYKPMSADLYERTTMGEMMNPGVNPGMFEHVTKMGRIGGSSQSKPRTRAHFRQIPYQGPMPVHTPEVPPSIATSPRARIVDDQEDIINISHSTPIASTPAQPAPVPEPDPFPEPERRRQPLHYEEMRLGRNMRAAPRGFSSQMADSAPDSDVSEPLLNLATNQPSNIVVDYLANTHPASLHQSSVTTSAVVSARTITSPQHPSQHLIEMLNRNQHYSTQLQDLEQEQERERESEQTRYQQQREQEEQQKQEAIAYKRRQEVLEAQKRHEQDILKQQQLQDESFPLANGAGGENEYIQQQTPQPTPRQTAGMSYITQTKDPSELASTRPFSPKVSGSYDYHGGASSSSVHSTLTSGTKGQAVSMEKQDLLRQETSDDVNDIEEDIIEDVEGGKDDDSDDALNF